MKDLERFFGSNEPCPPKVRTRLFLIAVVCLVIMLVIGLSGCDSDSNGDDTDPPPSSVPVATDVQLGPRPFFLVEDMDEGDLKAALRACKDGPFFKTDFSIGHRGAPLQFPEHTQESYEAAARMGAGIIECDVTFTKDRALVCRHSQCDLHETTNILETALASKCTEPFTPADPASGMPASVKCCTSDLTLAEFKSLRGKMDTGNTQATTVQEYMSPPESWKTDLYASRGTLLSHAESIALFTSLNVKMTPELKKPGVAMPFEGDYTQEIYAQQLINDYKAANVPADSVWPQSFNLQDLRYWIANEPEFGMQGVFLDGRYSDDGFDPDSPSTWSPTMEELVAEDVRIIAPPLWFLLRLDSTGQIVPTAYAKSAKAVGLEIVTWTLESSGPLSTGGGWYYQSIAEAITQDGDTYRVLDILAKDVGIQGMFSDWPATITYYANCMNLN